MHSQLVFLSLVLVCCSALEFQSNEYVYAKPLTAVIPFGKRLKLSVENVFFPAQRWRFNGTTVSEKCEVSTTGTSSTLVCSDMDWSDSGVYEYEAIKRNGQTEVLLAVNVTVAECTEQLAAKQQAELQSTNDCFCSGITNQCRKAENLFRYQIEANVTEADMIDLKITRETVEESWDDDQETETYYSLPKELRGNLLKAYGGYLDFPANDDGIDEDGPDVVLRGKYHTLVYHNRRELLSDEVTRTRILMTEKTWLQLDGTPTPKFMFMAALANVKGLYVKCNQYRSLHPLQITLDSADVKDRGLGKVTTVEECSCRDGYRGLSCERCAPGYYRRHAVGIQGICISFKEKVDTLKASQEWRHRFE